MSTSFTLWKVPSWFIDAIDEFRELAFDAFFESNQLEEDEAWTAAKVQEFFSLEDARLLHRLGDLFIPILKEGHKIHWDTHSYLNLNGNFVEGIHFLLTGKRQFYQHDFLVKKILLDLSPYKSKEIILVNALMGCRKLKKEPGLYATYLQPDEVKEVTNALPSVIDENFDTRWQILQELDKSYDYLVAHKRTIDWSEAALKLRQRHRERIEHRHSLSFSDFFKPGTPRRFIQKDLLPFLIKVVEQRSGIISVRSY